VGQRPRPPQPRHRRTRARRSSRLPTRPCLAWQYAVDRARREDGRGGRAGLPSLLRLGLDRVEVALQDSVYNITRSVAAPSAASSRAQRLVPRRHARRRLGSGSGPPTRSFSRSSFTTGAQSREASPAPLDTRSPSMRARVWPRSCRAARAGRSGNAAPSRPAFCARARPAPNTVCCSIADEVATGFGRTGRCSPCTHEDVSTDLQCLAKEPSTAVLCRSAATLRHRRDLRRVPWGAES
jgi:hypothetical protein